MDCVFAPQCVGRTSLRAPRGDACRKRGVVTPITWSVVRMPPTKRAAVIISIFCSIIFIIAPRNNMSDPGLTKPVLSRFFLDVFYVKFFNAELSANAVTAAKWSCYYTVLRLFEPTARTREEDEETRRRRHWKFIIFVVCYRQDLIFIISKIGRSPAKSGDSEAALFFMFFFFLSRCRLRELRVILVTECRSTERRCDNGRCMLSDYFCDSINDCEDYSDERNCSTYLIRVNQSINRSIDRSSRAGSMP